MREASSASVGSAERVEGEGAGEVVEAEVGAAAGPDQVLDLGIGLGPRQVGVELDEDDLGNRQGQGPCDLAGEELGDQRLGALAGAAELENVQAVVVGLDHGRKRPALAQRRDVAGGGDGSHSARILGAGRLENGPPRHHLSPRPRRADHLSHTRTEQDADGQANPFIPGRGQADPAPRHPLAVLEQGDLPRELISNASDACDKLRFEALDKPELYEGRPTCR
jgi:hypothetical protein